MTLAELLAKAAAHEMTPAERRAQRISMIYGLQRFDSKATKEQIADWLDRHEGHNASATADSPPSGVTSDQTT